MKVLIFIFFLWISLTRCDEINYIVCGDYKCVEGRAECFEDTSFVCNDQYDTYPETSTEMCNYKKKSQLIAFLLETFLAFGVGHFYTMNLRKAIPKLLFWILGFYLLFSVRYYSKQKESTDKVSLLFSLFGFIVCIGMLIWQMSDIFSLALNYGYLDGNGIELNSW